MRLFVAILPPAAALAELTAAVDPLRLEAPDLRWTTRQAWHLTLAFLGEVQEPAVPELSVRLERAARRHPPQPLAIAGAGAFPAAARAQVLWTGFSADDRALAALAASVAAAARRAGAPPPDEHRKYRPHLTLARCKKPTDVSGLTRELSGFNGSPWVADSIHLVRSYLTGGPPSYADVGSWPLAGSRRSST
jgi:RNA 2',3'-cyclic 3'-phosphodiesterase